MAVKITLTPQDILRGVSIIPAWYRLKTGRPSTQVSKKGDSTTFVVPFVVQAGPNTKDGKSPVGVPLTRFYSEKAPGFIVKLLKAYGVKVDETRVQSYDLAPCEGKEVEGYVENQLDDHKVMQNTIVDFRSVSHPGELVQTSSPVPDPVLSSSQ